MSTDTGQVYVQWKGTDVCLDFNCRCGVTGHFDGYNAYSIKCPACGVRYAMPRDFFLVPQEEAGSQFDPVVPKSDEDD